MGLIQQSRDARRTLRGYGEAIAGNPRGGLAIKIYPSPEAFYSENEARRRSPEADYGVWWWDDRGSGYCCRVSYVKNTGEVYAVHIGGEEQIEVLGVVPADALERTPGGNITSRLTYYRTLDRILEGWVNHMHKPGGLAWVRERLASAQADRSGSGEGVIFGN